LKTETVRTANIGWNKENRSDYKQQHSEGTISVNGEFIGELSKTVREPNFKIEYQTQVRGRDWGEMDWNDQYAWGETNK